EFYSEDDPVGSDVDTSEGEEKKIGIKLNSSSTEDNIAAKTSNSCFIDLDIDDEEATKMNQSSKQVEVSSTPTTKSKKLSKSVVSLNKESLRNTHGLLVQTTISTMLEKFDEKRPPRKTRKSSPSKVFTVSSQLKQTDFKSKTDQSRVQGPRKKGKVIVGKKSGTGASRMNKGYEDEDDDIQDFSSSSQVVSTLTLLG
ncbi:hypothetical protein CFOL_v3_17302, partial [Cephalotus follicularis]